MDYTGSSASSSSYNASGQHFGGNPCHQHFAPSSSLDSGDQQQSVPVSSSGYALLHHPLLQNYDDPAAASSPTNSPSSSSLPSSLYGAHHQRYGGNVGGNGTAGLSSLGSILGSKMMSGSSSSGVNGSGNNALAAAAASLFGGSFHSNGFASCLSSTATSPSLTTSSRSGPATSSSGYCGEPSSFFSPNGIHFQGKSPRSSV